MDRTLAHVVRLTNLLRPRDGAARPSAQFNPHAQLGSGAFGGMFLSWWYSDDTFEARDVLASLLIEKEVAFRDCDLDSVREAIIDTLQRVCIDAGLFNGDEVAFGQKDNLFECRRLTSVADFAANIYEEIKVELNSKIGKRCTVYALPRFFGPSFVVPDLGLRVISKSDEAAWNEFVDCGYRTDGWTPLFPVFAHTQATFPRSMEFSYILVSEEHGTQKGARFSSSVKFRGLIALLFGVASQRYQYRYHKSGAEPFTTCVQFSHVSSPDQRTTLSDCGALSPYFTSDVEVSHGAIEDVLRWYRDGFNGPTLFQQRLEKAAYFLNRGMNADDIEAYVNFFVTLDALFGERGSVEASISAGVKSLAITQNLQDRLPWLFDLRNELVHGGSRYVDEWPKYSRYLRHFKTRPIDDVELLARSAVLLAPGHFCSF